MNNLDQTAQTGETNTPNRATESDMDALFVAPDFLTESGAAISEAARRAFESMPHHGPKSRPRSVQELRAAFATLAPYALEIVHECYPMQGDDSDTKTGDAPDERASVPALFAHFGFVALALLEAEQNGDDDDFDGPATPEDYQAAQRILAAIDEADRARYRRQMAVRPTGRAARGALLRQFARLTKERGPQVRAQSL